MRRSAAQRGSSGALPPAPSTHSLHSPPALSPILSDPLSPLSPLPFNHLLPLSPFPRTPSYQSLRSPSNPFTHSLLPTHSPDSLTSPYSLPPQVDVRAKPSEAFVSEIHSLQAKEDSSLSEAEIDAKRQRLDAYFEEGSTALMYAAALGHHQVVNLLVAKGADCRIKDKDGQRYLCSCMHKHRTKCSTSYM